MPAVSYVAFILGHPVLSLVGGIDYIKETENVDFNNNKEHLKTRHYLEIRTVFLSSSVEFTWETELESSAITNIETEISSL